MQKRGRRIMNSFVMDNPFTKNGIYPIAYIEGYLYF